MNWPVKIILPTEPVPKINWRRWKTAFVFIVSVFFSVLCYLKLFISAEGNKLISPLAWLFIITLSSFLLIVITRVYIYGIALSGYEETKREAKELEQSWCKWANQKMAIYGYSFLTPGRADLSTVISGSPFPVYKGQSVTFSFDEENHTESTLFSELLVPLRNKIKGLCLQHEFEVIFIQQQNSDSFYYFSNCWAAAGLPIENLTGCKFTTDDLNKIIQQYLQSETSKIAIVVCINAGHLLSDNDIYSESASLLLIAKSRDSEGQHETHIMLRPMKCSRESLTQAVQKMVAYQPDISQAERVWLSGIQAAELSGITTLIHNNFPPPPDNRKYQIHDLDMLLGDSGEYHEWLSLCCLLEVINKTQQPQFMFAAEQDNFFLSVIKPG